MATGPACGNVLRHALAYAADLHRRCVVNGESATRVAESMGLQVPQVKGAVRLLRSLRTLPSPERLACVVMLDPGLDDADIAEIFGRSERWAAVVRSKADEICMEEHIDPYYEYLDDGLQACDPSPSEIAARAKAIHDSGDFRGRGPGHVAWELNQYLWSGHAFVQVGID